MYDKRVALLVNAGGQSRRMGQVKALLHLPPDDTPLVVAIAKRLESLVTDGIVVVSSDTDVCDLLSQHSDYKVVPDIWSSGGALGGVATGLKACSGWAMVVACDMPFVDPSIFSKLIKIASSEPDLDAVIPLIGGFGQPFHGLWHRRALTTLEKRLANNELGVQDALHVLHVRWVDEAVLGIQADDLAFYNVNTPREWEELLVILGDQKGR